MYEVILYICANNNWVMLHSIGNRGGRVYYIVYLPHDMYRCLPINSNQQYSIDS